ncbi:MAG TPA: hypothetical protein VNJ07_08865 [Chitinophagales bacterium]|nr:hypothetical protein [Chitinophagales bacterium]
MDIIYNTVFLLHETGFHPENRRRLEAFGDLVETNIVSGMPYLELIHPREHVKMIEEACAREDMIDADTVTSKGSFEAAVHAVGAAVMASQTNSFALVRPPGHHAFRTRASGFCLFNNIAVAVQKLVNEGKRVFIFDFDGHYGNGTADIFYNTNNVLYGSLHQYPAYPGNGFINEIGDGEGKGFNINIPLPHESGDDVFQDGCEFIFSIAKMFEPDVVAVSAGFDAHHADPLLNLRLTANSFHWAGLRLREHFKNIFAVLEGGYNTDYLPKCVYNFIDGINGKKIQFTETPAASPDFVIKEYQRRMHLLKNLTAEMWK